MLKGIAKALGVHRVEVRDMASFYAFFVRAPQGTTVIRLCNAVVERMQGADEVGRAFEAALGISFGETTEDGAFTLEHTPCIGMCDQAPAALVNDVVVTDLTTEKARQMVVDLKAGLQVQQLVKELGDGNNRNDCDGNPIHREDCLGLQRSRSISGLYR